ncbi:Fe(3+) ABC transporter substrate-binding protein [Alkalilimnicola sp. S0819]|nr:Fe(3+) ABC transporter substrate-binding protein [Alkalilimnicola sp. S0819]KAB7623935.1 Fe(3+) ABC transporter substrate-binding protein [Alkalilimnicola sp. S0819]MPQ16533.1 extracellular solute-binding protein [Alkalilimnicola sp. S0819]
MRTALLRILGLAAAAATAVLVPAQAAEQVNVYSSRQEVLIRPALDRFTEQTGIQVRLLSAGAGALLTRLQNEGRNTPADLLLTVDAGNLHRAKEAGVLRSIESKVLNERLPATYRDPDGQWYGLSQRARVIFRARDRVPEGAIDSYADLADPRWKGRICIRSSSNIYNQSLVAAMIAHQGVEQTESWARGLVSNMARPPQGGDRDQLKAVAAGQCDIAVANTYYYGKMLQDPAQREIAEHVAIVWPDQAGRGVHVNVSGAGVTRHARNPDNAVKLLEYLAGLEAQRWYAEVNSEYPVNPRAERSEMLQTWGEFKADELNLGLLGEHNAEAVRLMDRAGWR